MMALAAGAVGTAASPIRVKDVLPRWRSVFLPVGGSVDLAPRLIYDDGTTRPLTGPAAFSSADPASAGVSAAGVVTGAQPGLTVVTMRAGRYESAVLVAVGAAAVAHFSRDGRVLREYDPERSLFVRTLFQLDPSELRGNRALATRARGAGVNALTTGFYLNPADTPSLNDPAEWRKRWPQFWEQIERTANEHSFSLVLTGDDLARTRRELFATVTDPSSASAIELAFSKVRDSRRVICVEMIDEASYLWGDTPTPTDGRWLRGAPSVPDDAFVILMRNINRVQGRPPVSWPVGGNAPPETARKWMGNPAFSDYTSHYWSPDVRPGADATDDISSLPRILARMDTTISSRARALPVGRPSLLLTSVSGPFYTKRTPGDQFSPGKDGLQAPGVHALACGAEILYAAVVGMAGVRSYQFDSSRLKRERAQAAIGATDLQTGSEPFDVGTDRWQAMASAFSLIARLERYILQPQVHAPHLGRFIVTGARRSPDAQLLMVVSFSATVETAVVDLSPYVHEDGAAVTRYRIHGATVTVETVPNLRQDRITLNPGEAVFWLFLPKRRGSVGIPPGVRFVEPSPDAAINGDLGIRVLCGHPAGIQRVDVLIDDHMVTSLRREPFEFTWPTRGLQPGWHGLSAIAYGGGASSEARIAFRAMQS